VVGRSKSGCSLSTTLSFKDVHHPRCGGRWVEPGPYPPYGLVTHYFLQHLEGMGVHQSCGGDLGYTGPADYRLSAAVCLALWGWMALVPPPTLPPAVWSRRGCPSTARATVAPCAGLPHPWLPLPAGRTGDRTRRRTPRRWRRRSWMVLYSLLLVETGARTPSCVLRQPPPTGAEVVAAAGEATSCRGGCLRW
jgi:hypothetical protein